MNRFFLEPATGLQFFTRLLPDGVFVWLGESPTDASGVARPVSVFIGRRMLVFSPDGRPVPSNTYVGTLFHVPKGRDGGVERGVRVEDRESTLIVRTSAGTRTLVTPAAPFTNLSFAEHGCGFYDEAPGSTGFTLTGVWRCDDGGTYYVRDVSATSEVVWFGEHPSGAWSNVFHGRRSGNRISGRWFDVAKGGHGGSGEITLELSGFGPFARVFPATRLRRTAATGGFGGSEWTKTDTLRVTVRPLTLRLANPVGGRSSPYLMPLHAAAGGNEYPRPEALLTLSSPERPSIIAPVFENRFMRQGEWPKNNLSWREGFRAGEILPIPEYVGCADLELRTIPGLEPNSAFARRTAFLCPKILAADENLTPHGWVQDWYGRVLGITRDSVREALVGAFSNAADTLERLAAEGVADLPGAFTTALRPILDALPGECQRAVAAENVTIRRPGAGPDVILGGNAPFLDFGQLRDRLLTDGPTRALDIVYTRGAGRWELAGSISVSLSPAQDERVVELEVTLGTGSDDKAEPSTVELALGLRSGVSVGAFPAHAPGERFADRSLRSVRMPLPARPAQSNIGALHLIWRRRTGHDLFPDSWEMRLLRVAAFDEAGRRRLLRVGDTRLHKLEGNQTLTFALEA